MLNLLRETVIHPLKACLRQRELFAEMQRGAAANAATFPGRVELPPRFALGVSERAIETMFARLLYRPGLDILDIGHANAQPCHLRFLRSLPEPRRLTGLDIAEPVYDTAPYYTRSVRADIVKHPFADDTFDQIWCISTLEHFGMDISSYTDAFDRDANLAHRALREIVRMLKPGGTLLLTVPYGRFQDLGWLINYDAAHWSRLLDVVRDRTSITEWYFRHTDDLAWHAADPRELAYTGYRDQRNFGAAALVVALLTKNA